VIDVCAFGHITRESEEFRGIVRRFTAGPPYFFSIALRVLGSTVKVVTKLSLKDVEIIRELKDLGIEVIVRESKNTSSFHTIYGRTLDERYIKVLSIADPFTLDDLKLCTEAKYIYVGPLTTKDFDLEFLREAKKYSQVILDVQGFTRKVVGDTIEYVDWDWKIEGLKYVDIFKADRKEAKLITGHEDPLKALDVIMSLGPKEVLITSSEGAYLGVKSIGKFFSPFKVKEVKGRVGRGDTCTASYVHARLRGLSYDKALIFATAATSLKLQYQGPLRNSEEEVLKFVEVEYKDVSVKL